MKFLALFLFLISTLTLANPEKEKVIYKYKKYEKFDFDDLIIEGGTSGPGDLSIAPRIGKRFKNKLPYRKNFNTEIRKGIERVR